MIPSQQIRELLNWEGVLDALHAAHLGARPLEDSYFVGDAAFGLFSRGVISPGAGAGFKLATICPGLSKTVLGTPSEQGMFLVVDETSKAITAALDGPEITRWKTAADSALAARKLSRVDSKTLLAIGSGPISRSLISAFLHIRPSIKTVLLWNRSPEKLNEIHADLKLAKIDVRIVSDLDEAVKAADIITSATSSTSPLINHNYVRPGTHIDLVGGYRPDMQEVESEVLRHAVIYVDDMDSALRSGDIHISIVNSVISRTSIKGDLFDLCQDTTFKRPVDAITVYKNAGGAHLDLAVSRHVIAELEKAVLTHEHNDLIRNHSRTV